jgi:uncharacterized protein (DUF1501 family)
VLKSVLSDHLQVASQTLSSEVFPGSGTLKAVSLLKT